MQGEKDFLRKVPENLLEMYSSTFTLSDMEIFIFPKLLYALLLANLMSPVIWKWRDDPWFKGIEKKSYMQRINRVKQYIIDNFVFNLDLETWGLTTKETELERFKNFLDEETIAKSNALFGYEGDKFYFDIDIRKHFGLDKYTSNIIPYWKTETVEAMEAFRHKPDYNTGAGECVSLSTLYAAALFIVARIPLEKIFLLATPLHSQNFIDIHEGVLTNNRRTVTKAMWFNGTSLSTKARRALEKEEVTIVAHATGCIHTVYKKATIDPSIYSGFREKLCAFLRAELKPDVLSSFLRKESQFQCCFQYCHTLYGHKMYLEVEKIYHYEHNSPNSFSTDSRAALLKEIDFEEFSFTPAPDRILLNDFEELVKNSEKTAVEDLARLAEEKLMIQKCPKTDMMFKSLRDFLVVEPRLPRDDKIFENSEVLSIPADSSREDIMRYVYAQAENNETARLALYAYRDMEVIDWAPFIQAALHRNPVSLDGLSGKSISDVTVFLATLENISIYDDKRLALPDEIWNYGRGDGVEKAIFLANVVRSREPKSEITLKIDSEKVEFLSDGRREIFHSTKGLVKTITI